MLANSASIILSKNSLRSPWHSVCSRCSTNALTVHALNVSNCLLGKIQNHTYLASS